MKKDLKNYCNVYLKTPLSILKFLVLYKHKPSFKSQKTAAKTSSETRTKFNMSLTRLRAHKQNEKERKTIRRTHKKSFPYGFTTKYSRRQ